MHDSYITAHPIKKIMANIQQSPRIIGQIQRNPKSNHPRSQPNPKMEKFTLNSRMEVNVIYSVLRRKDIKIRMVNIAHQSITYSRVILCVDVLPPVFLFCEFSVRFYWFADIAHNSFCSCLASPGWFLTRTEPVINTLNFTKLWEEFFNQSGR